MVAPFFNHFLKIKFKGVKVPQIFLGGSLNLSESDVPDPTLKPQLNLLLEYTVQVDDLVLETLVVIRTKVEIEQDPPDSLIKLNSVAEKEEGWIQVGED